MQIEKCTANAGQLSVISWFQKNQFKIIADDISQFSNSITSKNGIYYPNEGYKLIPVFDQENNLIKDPYLVSIALFKSDKFREKYSNYLVSKNGVPTLSFKDSAEEASIMSALVTDGYIPVLHLEKEIKET